jgi:hypothetical protein
MEVHFGSTSVIYGLEEGLYFTKQGVFFVLFSWAWHPSDTSDTLRPTQFPVTKLQS